MFHSLFKKATLRKKTSAQVFACEYCEIFKYNYFEEHLRTTVSLFTKDKVLSNFKQHRLKRCFLPSGR